MADLLDRLTDTIRSGAIGKATKRSARWFQDKIKGLKGGLRNRFSTTNPDKFYRESDNKINPALLAKRASLGSLYCYHYDPKYKMTLPYYDVFPMIMLIGVESDTFLGLNFHYLPPKLRATLLDRVNAKIAGGVPNWKKISKIPLVQPAVKRYRFDQISRKVIQIEKEEEEIAIFLPLERFRKASKGAVWADSRRRTG